LYWLNVFCRCPLRVHFVWVLTVALVVGAGSVELYFKLNHGCCDDCGRHFSFRSSP